MNGTRIIARSAPAIQALPVFPAGAVIPGIPGARAMPDQNESAPDEMHSVSAGNYV